MTLVVAITKFCTTCDRVGDLLQQISHPLLNRQTIGTSVVWSCDLLQPVLVGQSRQEAIVGPIVQCQSTHHRVHLHIKHNNLVIVVVSLKFQAQTDFEDRYSNYTTRDQLRA